MYVMPKKCVSIFIDRKGALLKIREREVSENESKRKY
jgi:hypothetical protein